MAFSSFLVCDAQVYRFCSVRCLFYNCPDILFWPSVLSQSKRGQFHAISGLIAHKLFPWQPTFKVAHVCYYYRLGPIRVMGLLWRVQPNRTARTLSRCPTDCHCSGSEEGQEEDICFHRWRCRFVEPGIRPFLDDGRVNLVHKKSASEFNWQD